jgi:hypothetical protein
MSPNGQDRRQGNSSVVISLLLVVIGALLGVIVLLLWMPERVRPANETAEREVAKAPSPAPASLPEASESRHDAPSDAKAPAPAPTSPPKTTQSKKNEAPAAKAPAPPPPPPKRIGNPERIREVLQVGKTYESTLKVGLQASVLDADWGVRKTVTLNYVVENRTRRKVERNDGQTIVVLYYVVESRVVKLLSEVDISFDLGQPGIRLLAALDGWLTAGQGTAVAIAVAPLAEMILNEAGQAAVEQTVSKAVGMIDSLEGKKVRITYVDGEGVKSVEPVACSLDEAERRLFERARLVERLLHLAGCPKQARLVLGCRGGGLGGPSAADLAWSPVGSGDDHAGSGFSGEGEDVRVVGDVARHVSRERFRQQSTPAGGCHATGKTFL